MKINVVDDLVEADELQNVSYIVQSIECYPGHKQPTRDELINYINDDKVDVVAFYDEDPLAYAVIVKVNAYFVWLVPLNSDIVCIQHVEEARDWCMKSYGAQPWGKVVGPKLREILEGIEGINIDTRANQDVMDSMKARWIDSVDEILHTRGNPSVRCAAVAPPEPTDHWLDDYANRPSHKIAVVEDQEGAIYGYSVVDTSPGEGEMTWTTHVIPSHEATLVLSKFIFDECGRAFGVVKHPATRQLWVSPETDIEGETVTWRAVQ